MNDLKAYLQKTETRASIVIKDGVEISDNWYWRGTTANSLLDVWSITKSYASTCIGILKDEGSLKSLDVKVSSFFPFWKFLPNKKDVTIAHILHHGTGLLEIPPPAMGLGNGNELRKASYAPGLNSPGNKYEYSPATACMLLAGIIECASGMEANQIMGERIWNKVGMHHTNWDKDDAENDRTYGGIETTAEDLMKFGKLFLQMGSWDGEQLISEEWVNEATSRHVDLPRPSLTSLLTMIDSKSSTIDYG